MLGASDGFDGRLRRFATPSFIAAQRLRHPLQGSFASLRGRHARRDELATNSSCADRPPVGVHPDLQRARRRRRAIERTFWLTR
jgi:hypothetical protein